MKNGTCPKCNSREIYSGRSMPMKAGNHFINTIPVTAFTYAVLDNYVCGRCGYVESYIAKLKHLEKIQKKWPLAEKGGEVLS